LGLQIALNFVPVYRAVALWGEGGQTNRRSNWVFLWTETGANRWFFEIYIQGSKYNF